jgi:hypothetical protein
MRCNPVPRAERYPRYNRLAARSPAALRTPSVRSGEASARPPSPSSRTTASRTSACETHISTRHVRALGAGQDVTAGSAWAGSAVTAAKGWCGTVTGAATLVKDGWLQYGGPAVPTTIPHDCALAQPSPPSRLARPTLLRVGGYPRQTRAAPRRRRPPRHPPLHPSQQRLTPLPPGPRRPAHPLLAKTRAGGSVRPRWQSAWRAVQRSARSQPRCARSHRAAMRALLPSRRPWTKPVVSAVPPPGRPASGAAAWPGSTRTTREGSTRPSGQLMAPCADTGARRLVRLAALCATFHPIPVPPTWCTATQHATWPAGPHLIQVVLPRACQNRHVRAAAPHTRQQPRAQSLQPGPRLAGADGGHPQIHLW